MTLPTYRVSVVREGRNGRQVKGADDVTRVVAEDVHRRTHDDERESFFAVLLDARHTVKGVVTISTGSLESALVHPREVFRPAVVMGAAAIIVAHNHPSGDATPSVEDREVTERLREAGALLGIELLDHVVIGRDRYYSYASGHYHRHSDSHKEAA